MNEEQTGLFIAFHPARLSDADLRTTHAWALKAWKHAPKFCDWLLVSTQDEQVVRLRPGSESAALLLPIHKWSRADLADALTVVTAIDFITPHYRIGQLFDVLVLSLNAAVCSELTKGSGCHACC